MRYAQVVLGLPVDGPFDYSIDDSLKDKIRIGSRVEVNFRGKKTTGFVVNLSDKTKIKVVKPISNALDSYPVLNKNLLHLTKNLSEYYCCSWGEAIETSLPQALRKPKPGPDLVLQENLKKISKTPILALLIEDPQKLNRWALYADRIQETLKSNRSAILLLPDLDSVLLAHKIIKERLGIEPVIFYRGQPEEIKQWSKIRQGAACIVIGLRSGIFAPLANPGLIIVDDEESFAYKQDQVPHYHARDVAFMRAKIEGAQLILGSSLPDLETFYLKNASKVEYRYFPRINRYPQIKIVDMLSDFSRIDKTAAIFSRYLQDCILSELKSEGKVLLFLNRHGFSSFAHCHKCDFVLKCQRCNVNLVYHFKEKFLSCHYCNFKMELPKICPQCNLGYIKFSGLGTERIESEISRIFPQAKIVLLDQQAPGENLKEADIYISAQSVVKHQDYKFSLIGVIAIDNSLNRFDFRAGEKTFALLHALTGLTEGKFIVQTKLTKHYCFKALINDDKDLFYREELKFRKQLDMPPFRHFALIKFRGTDEEKAKEISLKAFEELKTLNQDKNIAIISHSHSPIEKLRGKFYWQILLSCKNPKLLSRFLKINLKNFRHSGIIVTVDIDPL
jgi:primosomal protein N' (replication factor Y)